MFVRSDKTWQESLGDHQSFLPIKGFQQAKFEADATDEEWRFLPNCWSLISVMTGWGQRKLVCIDPRGAMPDLQMISTRVQIE